VTIKERELEMNTEIRELTLTELGQVSGGADGNYKFCGPHTRMGTGLVPWYVDCNPTTMQDIYEGWAQRGRDLASGKTQF
jgi:hypothetical protein